MCDTEGRNYINVFVETLADEYGCPFGALGIDKFMVMVSKDGCRFSIPLLDSLHHHPYNLDENTQKRVGSLFNSKPRSNLLKIIPFHKHSNVFLVEELVTHKY